MDSSKNKRLFSLFRRDMGISSDKFDGYRKMVEDRYIEPTIIEERHMNATSISIYSRLFMERILFLGSDIDADVANIMNSQILFLEMENPDKNITMYINSPGGSVYDGLSIYDLMRYVSCPVTTTCIGMAASMAAVILSSGDKGKRLLLPNSQVMIHQPMGGTGRHSQASDIEIANREIQKCKKRLYDILAKNTGKTYEEIEEACDRDRWLDADEAIAFGLVDRKIESKKKE